MPLFRLLFVIYIFNVLSINKCSLDELNGNYDGVRVCLIEKKLKSKSIGLQGISLWKYEMKILIENLKLKLTWVNEKRFSMGNLKCLFNEIPCQIIWRFFLSQFIFLLIRGNFRRGFWKIEILILSTHFYGAVHLNDLVIFLLEFIKLIFLGSHAPKLRNNCVQRIFNDEISLIKIPKKFPEAFN